MRFGLLLPHFGAHASRELLLRSAARAEALGFDSLWVRDHLLWHPHGFEGSDPTFVDPFVALAAAAAVTTRVTLGTAVVIPTRWPLKLAQDVASLSWLSGGRVTLGIGLGFDPKEFAANGFDPAKREQIFVETVDICRLVWSGAGASYRGELFSFDDVTIAPRPTAPVAIHYGGNTPAAVRRAARHTEGWQVGRVPLRTLDKRIAQLRGLEREVGHKVAVVVQPIVSVARRAEDAAARVPIAEMGGSSEGSRLWDLPASGRFETIADLEGLVVCGDPAGVAVEVANFAARGVDEFIVDLRLQFDRFEEALELFGTEVLPRFAGR